MGTLMDSTSKRIASAIRGANASSGTGQAAGKGAKYHGGFESGGGTWGRAVTGRGEPSGAAQRSSNADQPKTQQSPSPSPLQPHVSADNIMRPTSSVGRRQRIRPNSAGVFSKWDSLAPRDLPKCPKGTSPRPGLRPRSATARPAPYRFRSLFHYVPCTPCQTFPCHAYFHCCMYQGPMLTMRQ